MKSFFALTAAALTLCCGAAANAQLVISQVYGGGGNGGSSWQRDFVELFNNSGADFTIPAGGWSVQYASSAGTTWQVTNIPAGTIIPNGRYLLVAEAQGAGGTTPLPTPDVSGSIAMALGSGKVALVSNQTALTGQVATGTGPGIIDFVGFGAANGFEGTGPTPIISNTTSAIRGNNGCTDSNDNSADFIATTGTNNIVPRNSASPFWDCNGGPVPTANINVTVVNNTGLCVVAGNIAANYTFTVTNAGPDTAASVTANLVSATSATPNIVVSTGTYSNGVWTIGSLANATSATLTYTANVTSPGAVRATLNALATTQDPDATDNSAAASNSSPDAVSTPKSVVAASIAQAGSPLLSSNIGTSGLQFFGTSFAFGRPFASPSGQRWVMVVENSDLSDQNAMLIVGNGNNFAVAAVENVTDFGGGVKPHSFASPSTSNPFDRVATIDDAGNIAFSCLDNAATPTIGKRTVVHGAAGANLGDFTWSIVAQEGDAASAPVNTALARTGLLWGPNLYVAGVNGANTAFYAKVTGGSPPSANNANEVLVDFNGSVVATESVTIPTGQAGATTFTFTGTTATGNDADAFQQNTDTTYAARGFKRTVNGLHWATEGVIGRSATPAPAPAGSDQVLVVDGAVVIQEGGLIPGFTGTDTVVSIDNNSLTRFSSLAEDGTWYAYGINAVVTPATRGTAWLVKGTGSSAPTLVAKTGDPIVPASSELWSGAVSTQTFLGVTARGNDSIIWGLTNNADSSRDAAVVWHNGANAQVILREGDPINLGPVFTGGQDVIVYCSSFIETNRAYIDNNRNAVIVVETRDSQWPCTLASADVTGMAIVKIALPAAVHACNRADIAGLGGSLGADGLLTVDDLVVFLSNFFSNNLAVADLTNLGGTGGPDGLITVDDLVYFLSQFFSPCNP